MLREDNLGLGAKIGTQNAETFGLSMFSGLLGRLNGKEEDQAALKKKEESIRDVQLKLKYGNLNFVRGGLLVGDKMCEVKTDLGHLKEGGKKRKVSDAEDDEDEEAESSKAAKKRRKEEKKQKATNGTAAAIKEMKRQRKIEAGGAAENIPSTSDIPSREAESTSDSTSSSEDEKPSSSKRSKKSSRKESKRSEDGNVIDKDEKARLKAEKRQRKEERRKRKEEKRAKRAAKEAKKDSKSSSAVASESETATASGTSTPTFMGGRQAVRHRYIMQKRMAAGSAQALKEIFMMKPQVAS